MNLWCVALQKKQSDFAISCKATLSREILCDLHKLGRKPIWCGRGDLNPHGLPPDSKSGASAIPPRPLGFLELFGWV